MQVLQELVHVVNKNKVRSIEVIGNESNNSSMVASFYEYVVNEKFKNDDEAAQFFYNTSANDSKYKKLKNKLKNRLINTVFFIDVKQPSYNKRQKAYYECYKDWAAVKILTGKNARLSAVNISHKILKVAKKYEFTELVLDIARFLRLHYGTRVGDIKRFEQFDELFTEYETIWQEENLAEKYYVELIIRYVNSKATQNSLNEKGMEYFKELQPLMEKNESYKLHLCGNLIKMIIHISTNDYAATVEACEQAIQFFKAKDYEADVAVQIFLHQQLVCFTQLRQFKEGQKAAEECLNYLEVGSYNWFKHQELYYLLSMHTSEYQQAYQVFNTAIGHRRFQFLPQNLKETWKIYEAYLHYLVSINQIHPDEKDKRFTKFRLAKFLNETPIFSKDKRGMNIPILIAQILFMIREKKYDEAVDRIEAIEKYCSRYLRKGDTFRSNCFIKMLLQIPISGFHKAGVERRAKKYVTQLKEVPIDMANQSSEIEIIPYEELWIFALLSLDNQFHKSRKR